MDRAAAVDAEGLPARTTATTSGTPTRPWPPRPGCGRRPVRETVADTWAWLQAGGSVPERRRRATTCYGNGIDPAKEAAVLAAWHAR